ncbi:pyridoxamine 5'-phosphate oxidase family protein [Pseudonocardia pini]|uniref:pyridoxamine 5'-phosphate oxidase family protein n=1 Tax=Pseudonocardia pini TaxID=2758030 RepID=UPI0015F0C890|nr:pyridoxamine 5'-phosphate oxidase family protein [Pseudonocardia pini]
MTSDNETAVAKIAELASDITIAMLTTVDQEGHLTARPMAQQETEFDGDLWFFVEKDSRTARSISVNPKAGVSLSSRDTWVSLSGTATLVEDRAKAQQLWNKWVEAWMPGGVDDPNLTLIHFHAEAGEYWDTPGGLVASALSFAKAKVSGERYEGTENETVDLR